MQTINKASDGRLANTATFILSTETVDRHGDIVVQSGLRLENFLMNPVALMNHRQGEMPVGTWSNIRRVNGSTLGDLQLAAPGTSREVDIARGLVEQGILRAVSISFLPIKAEPMKPRGVKYLESELLEVSLVSVPANPQAVLVAKSLGMSDSEIQTLFASAAAGDEGNCGNQADQLARRAAIEKKALDTIFRAKRTIRNARN